jgi:membrane associated rhomboid family serine protease
VDAYGGTPHRIAYGQQRTWQGNRVLVRLRLLFATTPIVTYSLMAINIAIWLILEGLPLIGLGRVTDAIYTFGVQDDAAILHDPLQAYRFLTAMFLHDPNSVLHIGLNMLSLYFVGVITERLFGAGRYTLIYFLSGLAGGLTQFGVDVLTNHPNLALGASGAIFGIFGAFGAFILLRRRQLGPAANGIIGQWFFFLILNLVFSFGGFAVGGAGIAGYDHLGGLAAGLILGVLLAPQVGRRR